MADYGKQNHFSNLSNKLTFELASEVSYTSSSHPLAIPAGAPRFFREEPSTSRERFLRTKVISMTEKKCRKNWRILNFHHPLKGRRQEWLITVDGGVRCWWFNDRWKALTLSFPTVFEWSKTDITIKSYESFLSLRPFNGWWKFRILQFLRHSFSFHGYY